jgi:UDP-GlcNAc:undecaprenyl-phosphate GlcNAc-1-phosphate transferase
LDLLLAFVLAMGVTMALIPLLTRFAGRLHVLDVPGPRKVHLHPVPRVGGLAMVAGALLPLLLWAQDDPRLPAYVAAAALLVAAGVWDDRTDLGYVPKFAAQMVAAAIIVAWGGVMIHSVTLGERIELPAIVAVPLTVVFIVGVTNAINLADGLDGLAGGTTLLSCCALALLSLTLDERFVATVSVIIAGSILGFLRFNTYPARIFMGDGGSQFLGFTVAVLAVLVTQRDALSVSSALPLLLLGLPILDTLSVMAQRIAEGRSPFSADRNHIHHRLLALGFAHYQAVILIYLTQAALFVAAWYLRYESDLTIVSFFVVFSVATLGLLHIGTRAGWRLRSSSGVESAGARPTPDWWRRLRRRLPTWALTTAGVAVAAYALRIALAAAHIPADVGYLCLALAGLTLLSLASALVRPLPDWIAHVSLYVAAVVLVYLDVTATPPLPGRLELPAVMLVAGCIMLSFRLTTERRFQLTPLDFLVVFMALALPNLPGSIASPRELGLAAVKLATLFYTVELLFDRSPSLRSWLQVLVVIGLGILGIRSLA